MTTFASGNLTSAADTVNHRHFVPQIVSVLLNPWSDFHWSFDFTVYMQVRWMMPLILLLHFTTPQNTENIIFETLRIACLKVTFVCLQLYIPC